MARRKWRCYVCQQSLNKVPLAPMLHEHVWNRLTAPHETLLCAPCLFERADRLLDHRLCLEDLRPCTFNLIPGPSWFDIFVREGRHEPAILDQWRAFGAEV